MVQHVEWLIDIPESVKVSIDGARVSVEGPKGKLERDFHLKNLKMEKIEDDKIVRVSMPHAYKKEKAMIGTISSHLKNMIKGVSEGFEYKMKIIYAHFPMNVKLDGKQLVISNFLGEKSPRRVNIFGNVAVKVSGEFVTINGINLEEVGQTAANIELATRVRKRDPRVFQDGIYLFERDGVPI